MKTNTRITAALLSIMLAANPVANSFVSTVGAANNGQVLANADYAFLFHDDVRKGLNIQFATCTEDKRGVVVSDPFNNEKNEIFRVINRGGGYVTISPLHALDKCINVNLGQGGQGLALHHWTEGDKCSLWMPIINDDGSVTFRNAYLPNYVIDIKNGDYSTGNQAITWVANGSKKSQAFFVKQVNGPTSGVVIPDGRYALLLHDDITRCLNLQFATKTEDKKKVVVVDHFNSEPNELFQITNRGDGYVTISPAHAPNLCINSLLANPIPGDGLCLHRWTSNDAASLWLPIRNGDGSYTFRNKATGYVMDVRCGDYSIGNYVLSWTASDYLRAQGLVVHLQDPAPIPTDSAITDRLNAMMSGAYGNGVYKTGTRYTGAYSTEQCKGFAKKVHMVLFGYNIGSTKSSPNNYQLNISSSKTRLVGSLTNLPSRSNSAVQNLFASARAGDFIQLRRSHGGSHSMIYLSSDANGVTVYECNVDSRNGIQKATYSWSKFRSSNAAVSVYTAKDYSLH